MKYALALLASTLFVPSAYAQGNFSKPLESLTLSAPQYVVYGSQATLTGKFQGPKDTDLRVEEDQSAPFGDLFAPTITFRANNGGNYSVGIKPRVNTQYRAASLTPTPLISNSKFVQVRPSISISVSDPTPRKRTFVRFRGIIAPAHDGSRAQLQRKSASGRWITIARPLLADTGNDNSSYSTRVKVYSDGVYRVKLLHHSDHASGYSDLITLDTHR